jgi:hypothetical protein
MKAPQQILCFAFAVMLSSTGWTRIGETLEDCIKRYGQPVGEGPLNQSVDHSEAVNYGFSKSGLICLITFYEGKAVEIWFTREDAQRPIIGRAAEILLTANGGGLDWEEQQDEQSLLKAWKTKDGSMLAEVTRSSDVEGSRWSLGIYTAEWKRAVEEYGLSRAKKLRSEDELTLRGF